MPAVVLVVIAVAAWQLAGGGDSSGSLNAIAAAAEKTQDESGGRTAMRAIVSSPDKSEPLAISSHGVFDAEERTRGTLTFRHPESGDLVEMQMVSDEFAMYMRSDLFGSLPGGREWMKLDFSFLEEPGSPVPAGGDTMSELELLEAVADDVEELGEEDVRGVPTTRYRGTVDLAKRAEQLRNKGAGEIAAELERNRSMRIEAWIDADGLLRRMRYFKPEPGRGGKAAEGIDMRMDFFDFGIEPEIDLPDSDDVFDATSIVEGAAGLSGDQ